MPNIIQHKRNSTPGSIPGTGSLAQGELGLNLADGRLYTKNSSNVIINLPVTSISGTVISPASGLFSGRIGVGTTSPSGTLQVVGTGLVSSVTGTAPNSLFHVYSATSGANIFNVEGTNGSLFSVVDSLSGSLMSVNNNAGLPVFEVFSDDRVVAGRYNLNDFVITSGGNIGVGISSPSSKMQVSGLLTANSGNFVNSLTLNGSGVAIISGTKLNQLANTSSSELLGVITDETGSGLLVFNNSPTLTGVPLAPTASSGTNTNQIASTAFVRTEISNLVASAPSTLDTLNELATALGNDTNFSTTVTNNLAGKADLSGATFSGTVSAPTGNFTILQQNGTVVSVSGHSHGNITSSGTIGSTSDQILVTAGGGLISTLSYAPKANMLYDITNDWDMFSIIDTTPVWTQNAIDSDVPTQFRDSISAASSTHSHGNISSSGTIGTTSGRPLITTADGVVTTGVFGNASGTFCQGNDSRLSDSRDPNSHIHYSNQIYSVLGAYEFNFLDPIVNELGEGGDWASVRANILGAAAAVHSHGNITTSGAIGATANRPLITTTNGVITTGVFGSSANTFCQGDDSRLSDARTPLSHTHTSSNITDFNSSVSGLFSKTYSVFSATDNQPPASAFATLDTRNSIAVLDFDDTTKETAVFVGVMPQSVALASGLSIRTHWMATTATSGDCRWEVSLERCNTDLDSDSFDTVSTGSSTTNGTAGIPTVTSITLTTIDSVAAGDLYRLRVSRDAANGADTMVGDAELIAVEVRSAQ